MNAPVSFDDLPDDICAWCSKSFTRKHPIQKYCCEACRYASDAAFERQWRKTIRDNLKCQHCGNPIQNAKKASQRYCCHTCRNKARTVRAVGPITAVRCIDCGGSIPGVVRRDTKRCPVCVREDHRKRNRERARIARAMSRLCRVE